MRAEVADTGALTARYDYDPFGQPVGAAAPADYGYAGEPRDAAAGLIPLRARWYAPAAGQFTARDPYRGDPDEPQGFNAYAYAQDDPVNGTDPTGLWRWQRAHPVYHQVIEDAYLSYSLT